MSLQLGLNRPKTLERLDILRADLEKGQRHLNLLDQQREQMRSALLRISGAIQVLEELLDAESSPNGEDNVAVSETRAPAESPERIST
jgi:hypothetical protein